MKLVPRKKCFDLSVSPSGGLIQELQQQIPQRAAEEQHQVELENLRQSGAAGQKKLRISPGSNSLKTPADTKTNNTGPACHMDLNSACQACVLFN